jgi:hypothetical protein
MIDRLRLLLDSPLDPSVARAVTVLASAIFVGVAALFVLGGQREDGQPVAQIAASPPRERLAQAPSDEAAHPRRQSSRPRSGGRQDPQDIEGSRAARRAGRTLKTHRALQHVPFRSGALAIDLVGARRSRAVVRVSAPTLARARAGWLDFLRRYRDAGRAYAPVFRATGGGR